MILYRPHRGSLADAISELKEFKTSSELLEYVYSIEGTDCTITWEKYGGEDNRIGWKETYIILKDGYGGPGFFTENLSKEECLKAYNKWSTTPVEEFIPDDIEEYNKLDAVGKIAYQLDQSILDFLLQGRK